MWLSVQKSLGLLPRTTQIRHRGAVSNPNPRELDAEGQKFKVILGCEFQTSRDYAKLENGKVE